jgi:hypothetical protein
MTGPRGRGVMCNVRARQQGRRGPEGRRLGRLAYPRFLEQEKSCSGATGAVHETDCNQKVLNCSKKGRWLRCCWEPGWEPRHSASSMFPSCLPFPSLPTPRRPDPAPLARPDSTSEALEPTPSKPHPPPQQLATSVPWWFAGWDVIVVLWPAPRGAHPSNALAVSAATATAVWLAATVHSRSWQRSLRTGLG